MHHQGNCPSSPCLDRAMMRALSMSTVLLRWRQAAALSSSMKLMKHTLEGTLRAANSLHGEEGIKWGVADYVLEKWMPYS